MLLLTSNDKTALLLALDELFTLRLRWYRRALKRGYDSEKPLSESPKCSGVIPNTFIACGEGGNYCSENCAAQHKTPIA